MAELKRPHPADDVLSRPFWEAARRGELVVQRCSACRIWQHPPASTCHRCNSGAQLSFQPVSGAARLFSWTVVHQSLIAGFEEAVPYVNLLVELDEQPGLLMLSDTASLGMPDWPLNTGARMRVWFEHGEPDVVLPQFRPAGETP